MKQKKSKIVIALLLSLTLQGLLYTEPLKIRQIKTENIEQNKKQINQLLFIHRAAKMGLFAVSSVANVVEFCRFLQFFYAFVAPSKLPESSGLEKVNVQSDQKEVKLFFLKRWVKKLKNFVSSKELWHTILFGSSVVATEKIMEIIHHPHTLRWFINKKVPCKSTFENMNIYATLLTHTTLTEEKRSNYKQTVHYFCNQLVKQIEQIIGFINYKETQFQDDEQQAMKKVANYIVHLTNEWLTASNKLFAQNYFDEAQFMLLTTSYKEEVNRELDKFSCIEGEIARIIL